MYLFSLNILHSINILITGLYGVLFANDEEAAFSNFLLWKSTGFIIAFILQTQVCIESKLYVLLGVLIAGMTGYFLIEISECRKKKIQCEASELLIK